MPEGNKVSLRMPVCVTESCKIKDGTFNLREKRGCIKRGLSRTVH